MLSKHVRDELLFHVPAMLFRLGLYSLVTATFLTMAVQTLREVVTFYTPPEAWIEIKSLTIPNIVYATMSHAEPLPGSVKFHRVLHRGALASRWNLEVVNVDDNGYEYCPSDGIGLFGSEQNALPLTIPTQRWLGASCHLPPGCFKQEMLLTFTVDGQQKQIEYASNKFSVSNPEIVGTCRQPS